MLGPSPPWHVSLAFVAFDCLQMMIDWYVDLNTFSNTIKCACKYDKWQYANYAIKMNKNWISLWYGTHQHTYFKLYNCTYDCQTYKLQTNYDVDLMMLLVAPFRLQSPIQIINVTTKCMENVYVNQHVSLLKPPVS